MENRIDMRRVPKETRVLIKKQIVRPFKKGMKELDIADTLNITKNAVSHTVSTS